MPLLCTKITTHQTGKYVGCGSAIKLTHVESGGDYTLASSGHSWGGGSGQQVVTLIPHKSDHSSLWLIREGNSQPQCLAGTPIACGQIIRLTHLQSQKNMHTHHIRSALSGQQEVSGFGEDGEGDFSDDWKILCNGKNWERGETIRLKHEATGAYLGASKNFLFDERNCRNCPIMGHMEVAGTSKTDSSTHFRAEMGVFLSV